MTCRLNNGDDWVVDSGATKHATYKAHILINKRKNAYKRPAMIPNSDSMPVKGRGGYTFTGCTKIEGISHVPQFYCNLLYVSRLTKNLQRKMTFSMEFYVMEGLQLGIFTGLSDCQRDLYRMKLFVLWRVFN